MFAAVVTLPERRPRLFWERTRRINSARNVISSKGPDPPNAPDAIKNDVDKKAANPLSFGLAAFLTFSNNPDRVDDAGDIS
jgi:hypothetical protein